MPDYAWYYKSFTGGGEGSPVEVVEGVAGGENMWDAIGSRVGKRGDGDLLREIVEGRKEYFEHVGEPGPATPGYLFTE